MKEFTEAQIEIQELQVEDIMTDGSNQLPFG